MDPDEAGKSNQNILAGCWGEIRFIFRRFRPFFNRNPTDFVIKSQNVLECRRENKTNKKENKFECQLFFFLRTILTHRRMASLWPYA